jgi:hypothetical protein
MPELLGEEPLLLDALRAGDSPDAAELAAAAAAMSGTVAVAGAASSPGGGRGGRARLARAAASAGAQLSKLLYLTEHLLALLYTHLRLCLPAPALAGSLSPDKGMLALGAADGGGGGGQPSLQTLGSERVSGASQCCMLPAKGLSTALRSSPVHLLCSPCLALCPPTLPPA